MDIRGSLSGTNTFYAIALLTILAVLIAAGVNYYGAPAAGPQTEAQVE